MPAIAYRQLPTPSAISLPLTALAILSNTVPALCSCGGLTNERITGFRVTTLNRIEMTQKLATKASFCISGMLATAIVRMANPSDKMATIAGEYSAAPGIYARAFLEGRLKQQQLVNFVCFDVDEAGEKLGEAATAGHVRVRCH